MHLFYDSTLNTWRLITEKLPEKIDHPCEQMIGHDCPMCGGYNLAITALKQNALTVGNPDIVKEKLDSFKWVGRIDKEDVYEWPGGVDFLEKMPPIAILTLPEEKKNTTTASGSVAAPKPDNYKLDEVFVSTMDKALIHTLSEQLEKSQSELASLRQQLKEREELIANLKQDIVRLVEDVNKAYEH